MKKAIIIGAGPAGLTAAKEFMTPGCDIEPIVLEASDRVGGICRYAEYKGNIIDIGGHRFFSKSPQIMEWWLDVMPLDGVNMLTRDRHSRIFFLKKFFDYPITLKMETFTNMGLWCTIKAGLSYFAAQLHKRQEKTLEDFFINHFGRVLYEMFFEFYTEKVWGVHPSKLGADWGAQRVKGVSVSAVLKDMMEKALGLKKNDKHVQASLIEQFPYPKYGPSQLWEKVSGIVSANGGQVRLDCQVKKIHVTDGRVDWVEYAGKDGAATRETCDYLLSSMPLKDLVSALEIDGGKVPEDVIRIASELPYRNFITVAILVKELKIKNETKIHSVSNRILDTWIYMQERDVKMGRLQIYNNWSPFLAKDDVNTTWLGAEYFCSEGDELWSMDKDRFIGMAIDELVKVGFIDRDSVLDATQIKLSKAYPAYFGTYYELDTVKKYLDSITNLYCIGRYGQHRYNNMDHSMLTAIKTVSNIRSGIIDKSDIWAVNTEKIYNENN